jgi:hypothetical protein
MDFVERWLGISPDGGDGSLEALFIASLIVVAALVIFRRRVAAAVGRVTRRTAGRGE